MEIPTTKENLVPDSQPQNVLFRYLAVAEIHTIPVLRTVDESKCSIIATHYPNTRDEVGYGSRGTVYVPIQSPEQTSRDPFPLSVSSWTSIRPCPMWH